VYIFFHYYVNIKLCAISSLLKLYSPTNAKKFISGGEIEHPRTFEVRRYRFLGGDGDATFILQGATD
jgi:hypothetical protein